MTLIGDAKREYQRKHLEARRAEWIDENGPCAKCGSDSSLEIDHKDSKTKEYFVGRIWSASKARREAELAKCQVLCHDCHIQKTREHREHRSIVLSLEVAEEIRRKYAIGKFSYMDLAREYGVHKTTIGGIIRKEHFKNHGEMAEFG